MQIIAFLRKIYLKKAKKVINVKYFVKNKRVLFLEILYSNLRHKRMREGSRIAESEGERKGEQKR